MCVIVGGIVFPIAPFVAADFSWVAVIIVAITLAFSLYAICSISYIVDGSTLTVRSGVFSKTAYKIDEIAKIKDTNSILSAPAASIDRIAIHFANKRSPLVISPKDKADFINVLKSVNPSIIYHP